MSDLRIREVYRTALAEHPEFGDMDEGMLKQFIEATLERIDMIERVARKPINISRETADNIGTIWVLSGTGSYDQPFKKGDNPRFKEKAWMGGFDRARLNRGAYLAGRIAEIRSGQEIEPGQKEKTKALISEFGPTIVYNGYRVESEFAEDLPNRDDFIMPRDKVKIIHGNLKNTADQVETFEYPDDTEAANKEVLIVTHAPHYARVLHMIKHLKPFKEGSVPYLSPVATPDEGRDEFAIMEARGLAYYAYLAGVADKDPYPYQLLH